MIGSFRTTLRNSAILAEWNFQINIPSPNKLQWIHSKIYQEVFLPFDFISFGQWSIDCDLEIGACLLVAGRELGS
jgi:hypothetical protein